MTDSEQKTKSQVLMEIAENIGAVFLDQFNQPYIVAGQTDHDEVIPLNSKKFKSLLANKFYTYFNSPANHSMIQSVVLTLTGQAEVSKTTYTLQNRVAWHDKKIFYDLTNPAWDCVEIDSQGWQITKAPLPLFKRYAHQHPQVKPADTPITLDELLNLFQFEDDSLKIVLHVWIISCFIPDIPHPALVLHGAQGSTKSTFFKFVRALVDPSALELISFPKDKSELMQNLAHHYFAPFDNVFYLTQEQSDVLCKAVTGEGASKRQLFTDSEDIIFSYRRIVCLNGINNAVTKPDLLDRAILGTFNRLSKNQRKTDNEVKAWFDERRAGFLTHIFDVLAQAMKIKKDLKILELPRMADFALWGESISLALGNKKNEFLQAYFKNIDYQLHEALEGSPIGEAIMLFLENKATWEGTPSELLSELEAVAEQNKIKTYDKAWPKAANSLSRRLNELKTTLSDLGLFVEDRKGVKRKIIISKNIVNTAVSSETTINTLKQGKLFDDKDDKDGIPTNLMLHEPQTVKVRVLGDSIPEFVLEDGQTVPASKKGDILNVSKSQGDILIFRKLAEAVSGG